MEQKASGASVEHRRSFPDTYSPVGQPAISMAGLLAYIGAERWLGHTPQPDPA